VRSEHRQVGRGDDEVVTSFGEIAAEVIMVRQEEDEEAAAEPEDEDDEDDGVRARVRTRTNRGRILIRSYIYWDTVTGSN